MSFSAYTIGCGRIDMRFVFRGISRLSEELEVVELPELTTGETSAENVSRPLNCVVESAERCFNGGVDVPSLCMLLANGLGPMLGPIPES